ncbi:MAG: hypothetical protein GT589_08075 [Peptoclostridium sp.]|uniref:hypothetical protein n=1 Tax=Peptoclostridium sp. TaxID=1904860 RepID=UPI00139CA9D7|nr:hypothetical protein [Peptoclostridium sp.]MZQ76088.1 hypothetical protein [Peptoclostridium sp.]
MSSQNAYKNFFDIDENYYASVSDELLAGGFVDWTTFYPHSTFIGLLKDTASILRRQQNRSIWVEGAYGTGKSHAVLTLKKILDASEEEVLKYFKDNGLDMDLFNTIQGAKKQGDILTVHRVGSSTIKGDSALVMAIQESIKKAISEKGYKYKCEDSLKESIIKWLSDKINAMNFNNYIEGRYRNEFGSDDSESIIHKLQNYGENEVADLTRKIFMVANNEGITALKLEATDLGEWIKDIIERNGLKSIVFIWDEFTEYFHNNKNAITGFQNLAQLSQTMPFYFVIVTHKSTGLFNEKDDSKKIIDRFINPTCEINLPENMAFKLMGKAMQIKDDSVIRNEWNKLADDLYGQIPVCSNMVMNLAKIDEKDLKKILPIHPYTAIILKHLSAMFSSNQRSMFEFIKNKRDEEDDRGFIWYIENHGPFSDENLLTIDMLWEYFYADGKANLEASLKSLLSVYDMRGNSKLLTLDKKKVLKTVLLLQGISEKNFDSVELFKPTAKNICNAYEGTELGEGKAAQIAEVLVRDGLLYKHAIGNNEAQYIAMRSGSNSVDVNKYKEDFRQDKKIKNIVDEYNVAEVISLSGALKLRYEIQTATTADITRIVNGINQKHYENTLPLVMTFALNDTERAILISKIRDLIKISDKRVIFVDTSLCDLSDEDFEEFITNLAEEKYWRGKDNSMADQYSNNASGIIEKWKAKLRDAEFRIITKDEEIKAFGAVEIEAKLNKFNRNIFSMGIENFNVVATMYNATNFKQGAKCGITQEISGQYRSSNDATKLENVMKGIWRINEGEESYDSNHIINKIKVELDKHINAAFEKSGKIAISKIYEFLKVEPYGFMPCNLTSFVLGFLLKDYADGTYRWSNEQVGDTLSVEKMVEMIDEIIKQQINPSNRYVEKYIVKMSTEEREFLNNTALVFGIRESNCATIEKTREEVRAAIRNIGIPLWAANIALQQEKPDNYSEMIKLINLYCILVNNNGSGKTESDIVIEIGQLYVQNEGIAKEVGRFINTEACKRGMEIYLNEYKSGELKKLAVEIGCDDAKIADLKSKVTGDSSWLWHKETINEKIDDLIIEYKIVLISNNYVMKTTSFKDTILAWADKMNHFKLPYEGIKNDFSELRPFLDCLYGIFTSKDLRNGNRKLFLEALQTNGEIFVNHFNNQVDWFKEKCSFDLNGLSDADIGKIFTNMPLGVFAKTNSEFQNVASLKITEYRKTILIEELKELWLAKTGTNSPREWSDRYRTPILCMADEEYDMAKKSFETLMQKMPSDSDIKDAIDYFKRTTIFERMRDEVVRNKAFKDKIIDKYFIIKDVDDAREAILTRFPHGVYEWYPKTQQLEKILDGYARKLYDTNGCEEALAKIESMSEANVKLYLKSLIKERIEVGMEILKDR